MASSTSKLTDAELMPHFQAYLKQGKGKKLPWAAWKLHAPAAASAADETNKLRSRKKRP